MSTPSVVIDNQWGAVIEYPESGVLEIRWYDTTGAMSGGDFNDFLAQYAGAVESTGCQKLYVDAIAFRMDMGKMNQGWRDQHIIPRYNAAGVIRFAFLMPTGMPAIGAPPAAEGPANFPTAYFATRAEAFAWLSG